MVAKTWIAAGAAILAVFVIAGPAAAAQKGNPAPNGSAALRLFDTNGDGFIDMDEAAAVFSKVDKDGDGKLSPDELRKALGKLANRVNATRQAGQGHAAANTDNTSGKHDNNKDKSRPKHGNRDKTKHRGNGKAGATRTPRPRAPLNGPRFQPGVRAPFTPGLRTPNNAPRFQFNFPQNGPAFQPRFRGPNGPGVQVPLTPRRPPLNLRNRRNLNSPAGAQTGQAHPLPVPASPSPPPAPPGATSLPQSGVAAGGPAPRLPGFNTIDRNGDGVITPDEFTAARGRVQ